MPPVRSSLLPLQSPLRPDPIPGLQETYLSTLETQLLATVLLLALIPLGIETASRVRTRFRRRYGKQLAEASFVLVLAGIVAVEVYAFSVVWHVTYILRFTLETMMIDRWLAARQLISAAVIVVAYLAIRFVNRSIDKLAQTDAVTKHQSEVAYHVTDIAIVGFAGTVLLTLWGIDLTNIFIGAGAITAVVALTARETLAALIAGFILLFSRPFAIGDWIEIDDTTGIVTDVTIFTTKIQTFGDKHILIPNDQVTERRLTNYSKNDQLRVDVEVGVDYETDLEHARAVVADAAADCEEIKTAPNPQVIATRFDDSSIVLECRVWIGDPTMRRKLDAQTSVIEAIVDAFDREGIDIPYPQRVHAARDDQGFRVSGPNPEEAELRAVDN